MTPNMLEGLGALLSSLADPTCIRACWSMQSRLGSAGTVTLSIDVNPQLLSVQDRDVILSFAAQLANWDHA